MKYTTVNILIIGAACIDLSDYATTIITHNFLSACLAH